MKRGGYTFILPVLLGSASTVAQAQNTCPTASPLSGTNQVTTTSYFYDAQGNTNQICDPRSTSSTQIYTSQLFDSLNRVSQVTQPLAGTTGTHPTIVPTYDGLDQVTKVVDPRSLNTSYTIDGLGNLTVLSSPDSGSTTNTYDPAGNLKTSQDARNDVSTYSYDAQNRVTSITYTSGTATTFAYDGGASPVQFDIGHLTNITDESGSTRLYYDGFGRVVKKVQITPSAISQTVLYAYSESGNTTGKLTSMTYPSGDIVSYTYDTAGRISSITIKHTVSGAVVTEPLLSNVTYNPFGVAKSWTWGNGTVYQRTFDFDGRLATLPLGGASTTNALIRTVNYDPASNALSMTHTDASGNPNSATNVSLTPDNLSRLTAYTQGSLSETFGYDNSGNRTSLNSYTNTVAPTSNQISATSGPAPAKTNTYSAGYLTSDGTNSYTYNARGRMSLANTTSYLYNGLGQRVYKNGPTSVVPTGINRYVYDEAGHLLGEYDTSGNAISETIYLGDTPIGAIRPN